MDRSPLAYLMDTDNSHTYLSNALGLLGIDVYLFNDLDDLVTALKAFTPELLCLGNGHQRAYADLNARELLVDIKSVVILGNGEEDMTAYQKQDVVVLTNPVSLSTLKQLAKNNP